MQYAGIIKNDFTAASGVSLTFFTQGCPHKCKGCHNPETWSYTGGEEFTPEVMDAIISGIKANGIMRKFCIMGGEPLCPDNVFLTDLVVNEVKKNYPDIKIYIWTGYVIEDLTKRATSDARLKSILSQTDYLIDGPFIQELRDVSLFMRGSSNQRVIGLGDTIFHTSMS